MLAKARMHAYPGLGAGWLSFNSLYKGLCVYFYGRVSFSDVPGSLKMHYCFVNFGVGLKMLMSYRVFLQKGFNRVYLDLGAMQYQNRDWARPGAG